MAETKNDIVWDGPPVEDKTTPSALKLTFDILKKKREAEYNHLSAQMDTFEEKVRKSMDEVFQNSGGPLQTHIELYMNTERFLRIFYISVFQELLGIVGMSINFGEGADKLEAEKEDNALTIKEMEGTIEGLQEHIKVIEKKYEDAKVEIMKLNREIELVKAERPTVETKEGSIDDVSLKKMHIDTMFAYIIRTYPNDNDVKDLQKRWACFFGMRMKEMYPELKEYLNQRCQELRVFHSETVQKMKEAGAFDK